MSCANDHHHFVPCCPMHAMLRAGSMMAIGDTAPSDGPTRSFSDETAREPTRFADGDDARTRDLYEVVGKGCAIVICGGTVLPMAGGALPDHDVVAIDGVIRGVQPSGGSLPDDALVVDAVGKFVMPGLTDIHQHPPLRHLSDMYVAIAGPDIDADDLTLPYDMTMFMYLAAGITRLQVMAGTVEELALRAAIRTGRYRGPSMRIGMLVDGSPMMWSPLMSANANDAEGGRKAARTVAERGYDFIKPYSVLNAETHAALAAEARALGLEVMGHIPRSVSPEEAFAAGQTGVAHVFEYFYNDFTEDRSSIEARVRRAVASRAHGVTVQATLVVARMLEYDTGYRTEGVNFEDMMDPLLRKIMREDSPFIQSWRNDPHICRVGDNAYGLAVEMCQALLAEGVPLLTGTDCVPSSITGQHSLHHEFAMLVGDVGMAPIEVLKASTIACAEYQGEGATAGTIEPGKRSDLLVLDRDPTADIAATRAIDTVIIGDAVLRRDARERGLARLKAIYDAMPVPE